MKIKEILKRAYYALTSIALFLILLDAMPYDVILNRRYMCLSFGFAGILLMLTIGMAKRGICN